MALVLSASLTAARAHRVGLRASANRRRRAAPLAGRLRLHEAGLGGTPDLTTDDTFRCSNDLEHNWNDPLAGISYVNLHYDTPASLEAKLDGVNTVKFRTDGWCHDGDHKDVCYSTAATAITTVLFVEDGDSHAGTILDADIELNDVNFIFTMLPTTPQSVPVGRKWPISRTR